MRTNAGRDRVGGPRPRPTGSTPNASSTKPHDRGRRRLVERDADRVVVDEPQVDPPIGRGRDHRAAPARNPDRQRVEEVLVHDLDAARAQRRREPGREPVHPARDRAQAVGAVVRRRRDPAMTASSTCAVQMLLVAFSRRMCCSRVCKREPERGAALRVDRDADEPARQRAPVLVAHREVRRVRTAEAERHAEALGRAHHRVGADLAGRRDEREREQVGRDAHRTRRRGARSIAGARSRNRPLLPGYWTSTPKHPSIVSTVVRIAHDDLDPERLRARAHDVERLRVRVGVDEEHHRPPSG